MESKDLIHRLSEEELFKKYYPRLCDFALRYVQDEHLAEDLVQDAFVSFLENKHQVATDDNALKAFLYSCVKFACLNRLRHKKVKKRIEASMDANPVEDPKFLEAIVHAEIMGKIHEAINELPKGCYLIFKEGYLEGLSNQDLAKKLGISINTVKSQKQRGLMLLKRKYITGNLRSSSAAYI
ncbi:RNA polymerase sigma-70 factor [Olivibacter sp. SDN3]|uniref:RNA polymerase sigma-70 factor n=1 Tax=Olivibacter sp. SDN3 TaxID=2764720 RepID=UPI00165137B6|nr:RNA polymerase sigma-70 factor [Olivibacter sp. SDN3]QNL50671.1 RNA polymerase sigma-70 factor [Olivibacter sp. SDN3]